MNRLKTLTATVLFAVVAAVPAYAQQPTTPQDPHHPDAGKGTSATPGTPPPPGAAMPMEMCGQMMGDMMPMPMMGSAMSAGPKERADMLQIRGEMMKAMGDIMMKHARRMQGTPSQ